MKYVIALFLAVVLLAVPGCGTKGEETGDLAKKIYEGALQSSKTVKVYDHREESAFLAALYGEEEKPEIFSSVEECTIVLSKNDGGFEIQILKMRHLSQVREGERLLRQRMELLQSAEMRNYLGQRYEDYIASAVIFVKGRYVFLLATGDNERALRCIEKNL